MQPAANAARSPRTVLAGVIGNVLEWYDFALFGFLAPVISPLFFPSYDPLDALLSTYGVFAVGFLMRPIGGMIFGHIGDRLGRKTALQWSVLLMAVPTTLISLLPTHQQVGQVAPVLLTLLRMLQGLSVGGEFIGSMSFLGEHADARRRGYLASWSTFGGGLGNLLGCGVAALTVHLVPADDLHTWGWRVPFVGGLVVGLVGMWLRRGVAETPCFQEATRAGERAAMPLLESVRRDRLPMVLTAGLAMMLSVGFYLPWLWVPTWLATINTPSMPLARALAINTGAMAVMILLTPLGGALSDRLGRKAVMGVASSALALLAYPLFLWLAHGTLESVLQAQLVLAVLSALVNGPAPAAFVELFPTRTRYSGIALAYNGTLALLGGTTPLIATWLIQATGWNLAPAFFLLAAAAVTCLAVLSMKERAGQPLQ
jgi:MFS transporter, MHS family, proline/betaine transporter